MINQQQKQTIQKLLKSKTPLDKIAETTKVSKKEIEQYCKELKPKQYSIKLETHVPATFTYTVVATSPEEAAEMIKKMKPTNISYKLSSKRDIRSVVYEVGSALIKLIKKYNQYV
jgi:hypothetical protein